MSAASPAAGLSEAIRSYRRAFAEFNFRCYDIPDGEMGGLAALTYEPALKKLADWTEPATCPEEAADALLLAMEEEHGVYGTGADRALIKAACGFLTGRGQ